VGQVPDTHAGLGKGGQGSWKPCTLGSLIGLVGLSHAAARWLAARPVSQVDARTAGTWPNSW
jgi:hypothetical protein